MRKLVFALATAGVASLPALDARAQVVPENAAGAQGGVRVNAPGVQVDVPGRTPNVTAPPTVAPALPNAGGQILTPAPPDPVAAQPTFTQPAPDPRDANRQIAAPQPAPAAAAGDQSWRFKWQNNRWWYWLPEKRWVYWDNNRWTDYRPAAVTIGATPGYAYSTPGAYSPGYAPSYYGNSYGLYGDRSPYRYGTGYRGFYGPGYGRGYSYGQGWGGGYGYGPGAGFNYGGGRSGFRGGISY